MAMKKSVIAKRNKGWSQTSLIRMQITFLAQPDSRKLQGFRNDMGWFGGNECWPGAMADRSKQHGDIHLLQK